MYHFLNKHAIVKYFDIDEVQALWPDVAFGDDSDSKAKKRSYYDAIMDALRSHEVAASVSILSQCAYLCRKLGCVPLHPETLDFLVEKANGIDKEWFGSDCPIEGIPTQSLAHLNALWLATAISYKLDIEHGRMAQFCDWWKRQEGTVYVKESSEDELATLAEESTDPEWFFEGSKRTITFNTYERDENARRACIKHWGTICCVCGFDFGATYGDVGIGFIHVHHLKPLAEVGEQYKVDPIEDLRPVCPNCHEMIHRHQPAYTPDEVRAMIKS